MNNIKNWHAFRSQTDASVATTDGPFVVGSLVKKLDCPENSAASGLGVLPYEVLGYTKTGGVVLKGFCFPVSAKHVVAA